MQWAALKGMDESRKTMARAVELGWVILQPRTGDGGSPTIGNAALTDEGRRLARKGR